MKEDFDALFDAWPGIQEGIIITLELTAGGALLAFVLAVVLGLAARSHQVVVRGSARVFIEFFRGTSLLVQLFWLFYVVPLFGYLIDPVLCGILALGLNYGAYGAEVVRGRSIRYRSRNGKLPRRWISRTGRGFAGWCFHRPGPR